VVNATKEQKNKVTKSLRLLVTAGKELSFMERKIKKIRKELLAAKKHFKGKTATKNIDKNFKIITKDTNNIFIIANAIDKKL